MEIDGCVFPDDRFYDRDGFVWVKPASGSEVRLGITAILAALAGRLTKVEPKPLQVEYEAGRIIGTVESGAYFGPIRTPVSGALVSVNEAVLQRPKILSEDPYASGWFARLRLKGGLERSGLLSALDARPVFQSQIEALHIRCFAAFPDYEMFEIGTECAAVLVRLDELVSTIQSGEVVHVVSDDPTAPIEMARWSDRTGHPVVDSRRDGELFHFLVRKV